MSRRRAAYFVQRADYAGRPFDDGILGALDDAGFEVDYFTPNEVEYRRAWLQRQLLHASRWRAYDVFLGSADLPMAFAGALAALARKPVVTACDEIYIGGYAGIASGLWKPLVRQAMRQSAFTIITDRVRIPLQREYAGLPASHEFVEYPCCFSTPYDGPRAAREGDRFVLSLTGAFAWWTGAQWAVPLAGRDGIELLVQPGGPPDAAVDALLRRADGVIYKPERVSYREAAAITATADASFVCYLTPFPEFRHMGVSSQKLCTSLWVGVPVIAARQESFAFVEELRCGVLIDRAEDLPGAVARICEDREGYRTRALAAVDTYVRPAEKRRALAARFARL